MTDTKRYRVCETCNGHGAMPHPAGGDGPCPDCGHGDCAPGVVDAGVVWSREWPEIGTRCYVARRLPGDRTWRVAEGIVDSLGLVIFGRLAPDAVLSRGETNSDLRFAPRPLTIPDPPKE